MGEITITIINGRVEVSSNLMDEHEILAYLLASAEKVKEKLDLLNQNTVN